MPETALLDEKPKAAPEAEAPAPEKPPKKKFRIVHKKYWIFFCILCVWLAVKWCAFGSQKLSDWYLNTLQAPMSSFGSRISYLCPVPVYELAMAAAVMLGFALLVLLILLIFLRKKAGYRKFMGGLMRVLLVIGVIVFAETEIFDRRMLSGSVLGHESYTAHEHDLDDVREVYNDYIAAVNELVPLVTRDENNHFIHPSEETVREELKKARKTIQGEFVRFTVDPPGKKTSLLSAFLDVYGISAYTVSPSMEIVFNQKYEYSSFFASIYAHEFSHFCGYWREDEANYLGYRLCMASSNPDVRYAGILDLYVYVSNSLDEAYFGTKDVDPEEYETEEYSAFCETLTDFTDTETLYLFLGDRWGKYKLYHQLREEENVVDEKPALPTLPDSVTEVVSDLSQSHWENLHETLGAHYYDGVMQLIFDDYSGGVLQPFTHAGVK